MLCSDCNAKGQIRHGRRHTVKPKEQKGRGSDIEGNYSGLRHVAIDEKEQPGGRKAWLRYFA